MTYDPESIIHVELDPLELKALDDTLVAAAMADPLGEGDQPGASIERLYDSAAVVDGVLQMSARDLQAFANWTRAGIEQRVLVGPLADAADDLWEALERNGVPPLGHARDLG